jgi:hypothetical protein
MDSRARESAYGASWGECLISMAILGSRQGEERRGGKSNFGTKFFNYGFII